MYSIKVFLVLLFLINIFGCTEKTTFSGKLLSENDLTNLNIKTKAELLEKFGKPSYYDNFQNRYFYFTEKNNWSNFYNKETEYSFLFVFKLNDNNEIIKAESIDLKNKDLKKYEVIETQNNIIERGLIEKIFGGVGANQLPNSE